MEFFAHLDELYQMGKKPGGVKKSRCRKIWNLPLSLFDKIILKGLAVNFLKSRVEFG